MEGRYFTEEQNELALGGTGNQFSLSLVGGAGGDPDRLPRRDLGGKYKTAHGGRNVRTPVSRARDPEGSHNGAEAVRDVRELQVKQVADFLRSNPGSWTGQEIARDSGLDRYMVGRRLSEAETAGLVERGDKRKCQVTGITVGTWMAKGGRQ